MKVDHLSEQLRATRDLLQAGEIEGANALVLSRRLDRMISMASLLETELAMRLLCQRAGYRRVRRIEEQSALFDALNEPDTNVTLFPIAARRTPDQGGNAA